ncbi:MAG TPA: hypothetical protein ENN19_03535 [Chloroflexi bacterium]|nr:hypothetical protein [Chloroflexota bacterium]
MDDKSIYNFLFDLICLAPFCLGLLAVGGAGFLIIRTIRRQWSPRSVNQLDAQADELEVRVQGMISQLREWTPDALADLSTDWDAKWSRWGRDLKAHGTIPSLSHPEAAPYVAFALRIRGAFEPEGVLFARSTRCAFEYRLSRAGVGICVDDAPFGRIQPDGQLLDAQGRLVGEAKRPGGLPVIFQIGGITVLRDKREREYPLVVNGKAIGRLANPSAQMLDVIDLKKRAYAPVAVPAENITEQESLWLTALAILQVAGYNLLESVWTN